jgi:large subunit ribosomal protein L18
MTQVATRGAARQKRHDRIRLSLAGTGQRPRLAVFRSLNHIYAQVIDDASGRTLAAASTVEKDLRALKQTKAEEAGVVGRAGYRYHGRVKSLAEAARQAGLDF